jgi:SprT protein
MTAEGMQPWFQTRLDEFAELWGASGLGSRARIEFSARLRRSLGLCYPQRDLIRLNPVLKQAGNRDILGETVTHEAAHLVVYWRHGRRARPHGSEWQQLMVEAGLPARATIQHSRIKSLPPVKRARYLYRHRCVDCGNIFNAGRTDRRWRCAGCHHWGRGGVLKVVRMPIRP